jgi:hypothetical protein
MDALLVAAAMVALAALTVMVVLAVLAVQQFLLLLNCLLQITELLLEAVAVAVAEPVQIMAIFMAVVVVAVELI